MTDPEQSETEKVAELLAQHGAARDADSETIAACLPSLPRPDLLRTRPRATERS